ncbi:MAG TPA: ABC transporter substrate-binding protein [Candidatus Cloacimonadota bacterium]|nr:ABC transporter substrate-binding protein [Candidatus Cloacimonadota bacterium]
MIVVNGFRTLWQSGSSLARIGVALLCSVFMIFSACKRDNQATRNDEASKPHNSSLSVVRIVPKWEDQAQFAGLYVAKEKGFFARREIDAEILPGGTELLAMPALNNGEADFAILHLLTVLKSPATQPQLVNLAQISQKSSLIIAARKDFGINKLVDLKYKRIGLWKGDYQEPSLIFNRKYHLEMDIINIDSSVNLLISGLVEAMNVMRYNELHQLYQAGMDEEDLLLFPFSELGLNIPEDGLYTTEQYYLANPDLCRDVADALMEGWLYAINNEEEALDIVLEVMRKNGLSANRPHQKWMLKEMKEVILARPGVFGSLEKNSFDETKSLLSEGGYSPSTISYERFYPYVKK